MFNHVRAGTMVLVLLGLAAGCRRETPAAAADSSPTGGSASAAKASGAPAGKSAAESAAGKAVSGLKSTAAAAGKAAVAVVAPIKLCGDDRDVLLTAYAQLAIPLSLKCTDFTQTRRTEFFGFGELVKKPSYGWVLLRDPLLATKDVGFGLDLMIQMYGAPREINSSYRDPIHNQKVGGAKRSRHVFGDAADVRNVTRSREEWDRMWTAAEKARADYIEPLSGPCKLNCLHADWRNHDGKYGQ